MVVAGVDEKVILSASAGKGGNTAVVGVWPGFGTDQIQVYAEVRSRVQAKLMKDRNCLFNSPDSAFEARYLFVGGGFGRVDAYPEVPQRG